MGRGGTVNVRGQVFAPGGGPLQQVVRLQLQSDDALRPPDYIFTDSNGRFILYSLNIGTSYTITVESDGKNWPTTSVSFIVTDRRMTVNIDLRPLESKASRGEATVSIAELKQNVPKDAKKEYDAAMELFARGEHGRARPLLERAIELYPDYVDARNELSVALLKEGKLADAETQLRRALQIDGAAVRPLLNLGLCLYRQERYADALPFLEKALQLEPEQPNGQLLLGINLVILGDDARAEPALLRAYELGGKRVARAQFYLARLYIRRKDHRRAAEALETYLRDVPGDPDAVELRKTLEQLRTARTQP
jgi:tetratricopeptide (TPR) repeat protein